MDWAAPNRAHSGALDPGEATGPEGTPVFAVDISHWSGELTDGEVGCWYDEGVRHVITGTQNYRVMRQQLDQSLAGGMSVDAYVYLHWNVDVAARVREDLDALADYPIGRYWLDVEEHPGGRKAPALAEKIQQALDVCEERQVACGIYTAGWWWRPHMRDRDDFAHVPLWYAHYDEDPSLDTWADQSFGGWQTPWAKQWTETYFCGIDVDKNTMFTEALPQAPPREFVVEPGVPRAPKGLYPAELVRVEREVVRILVDAVPGAAGYEFDVEYYQRGRWLDYVTFKATDSAVRFSPAVRNRVFRFRARAQNDSGFGAWSGYAYFEVGVPREVPPETEDAAPVEPTPETTPLDEMQPPDGAQLEANASVVLQCSDAVAEYYRFEVEFWNATSGAWLRYATYSSPEPRKTFYPTAHLGYRWRVQVEVPGEATTTSPWRQFVTGRGRLP